MTATMAQTTDEISHILDLLAAIDPVVLAAALVRYAEQHPADDVLLVALALAVETANLRRPSLLDDYIGGRYHRQNPMPEYTELQRLRYPPTGNRELWVRYGPAGPPESVGRGAA